MASRKPKAMDTSHLQTPVALAQSQPSEAQPVARTSYVGGSHPASAPPRKTMPARPFSSNSGASIALHRMQTAADAAVLRDAVSLTQAVAAVESIGVSGLSSTVLIYKTEVLEYLRSYLPS
jgi:hypothetical protein